MPSSKLETARRHLLDFRLVKRDPKKFVSWYKAHPDELQELIDMILRLDEYPYKEYASWILTHLCKSGEFDFQYLYPDLVDLTFRTDNQSVLRNVVQCITTLTITDYRESEFIDQLIGFIQNSDNKVALHVYSIYVLIQFVKRYPELLPEILTGSELVTTVLSRQLTKPLAGLLKLI